MAVIETWLRQDLKGLVTVRSLQGQVFSLDNGGNLIGVKVTKDGKPVTLTGTVTGYCILSDGQTVTVTGSGKSGIQNGNEAYIVLPQLVYSVPGQISIVIKLTSGSVTTTLAACTGYVYRSRTSNEVVPPGTPIPDLSTLEEVIRRATAATDAANAATVGAEKVDASMTKEGDVITITVTDRDGNVTEKTVTDQTEAMKHKADINGNYPELTSGTAEQLVSTQYVENTELYKFRPTGGSADVGNREYLEKIVGGTVCWNQLCDLNSPATKEFSDGDRYYGTFDTNFAKEISLVKDHVYLIAANIYRNIADNNFINVCISSINTGPTIKLFNDTANGWAYNIHKQPDDENSTKIAYSNYGGKRGFSSGDSITVNAISCYDLTVMLGSTIADYVYNLEQTTAGAGVTWFRRYFPNEYYEYNPGELISVSGLHSHDTVGFNVWDEEWELGSISVSTGLPKGASNAIRGKNYSKVLPNARYSITKPAEHYVYIVFYDDTGNPVQYVKQDGDTAVVYDITARATEEKTQCIFTVPSGATRIRFRIDRAVVYNNDVCINLVHSGTRNGEYEPYEKHSYPLDSSVTLNGFPMLDTNGNLCFDGDEYASNGTVARNYQKREHQSGDESLENAITDGTNTVIKLATPTAETADPYTEIQVCNDWGTEEFVSDSILPVGHLTQYPANLRDKLQHLPSPADTDGDYIVRQSGSQMSLVGLGDTAEISKLKSATSAQGIYVDTNSSPIASISDGADDQPMRSVEVAIEPVQDLHGYEHPWPAGGGKNLLPGTPRTVTSKGCTFAYDNGLVTLSGTADGDGGRTSLRTANFTLKAGTYTFKPFDATGSIDQFYIQNGSDIISSSSVGVAEKTFTLESDSNVMNIAVNVKNGVVYDYRALWGIFADSAVTEWTPYSNVCPISGWTGAKVTRCGKNLFDEVYTNIRSGSVVTYKPVFVGSGIFTLSSTTPNSGSGNSLFLLSGNVTTGANSGTNGVYAGRPITMPSVDGYVTIGYRNYQDIDPREYKSQLEVGSIATSYESYTGNTYEVAFPADPGTVYGGTLDVASGKLVVDRATVVLDGATETWSTFTSAETGNDFRFRTNGLVGAAFGQDINGTQKADWLATTTGYTTSGASPIVRSIRQSMTLFGNQNRMYVYVPDIVSNESDIDGWKAYLAQHPLTVSYLLAEPQEITLTPTEIKTLLGVNNVWSDAGNTAITYLTDTKMYIDNRINSTRKLIAGIEAEFTASKLYAVGDMLIIGDDLYKVTARIASGATITVGTNVTKTTVAEQLIALMNA